MLFLIANSFYLVTVCQDKDAKIMVEQLATSVHLVVTRVKSGEDLVLRAIQTGEDVQVQCVEQSNCLPLLFAARLIM